MPKLCAGKTPTGETQREIKANDRPFNNRFQYADNHIKTSKYSIVTFLPLNLFEQFQRLANFYFLCLLILQIIPVISSLSPVTTAVPLIGVLALTAVKDAFDDIQRHRTDRQVNNRKSLVLRKGELIQEKWHRVHVGDVIMIENNQFIAADILPLSSSNPNGLCYIETAELDGETNLKSRMCPEVTNELSNDRYKLSEFKGHIMCEAPNNNLSRFEGLLRWNDEDHALSNDSILLRGAILRNTVWCYGVVIFAGKDTKLMQNSGKTKFKRTSIDGLLNIVILQIVFLLLCMCLFCTIACGVWEALTGEHFQTFLPWEGLIPVAPVSGSTVIAILVFFSYAIVLNTVVPISLYVSVEVIRLALSFLIGWDLGMYYDKTDTPAKARTTTLNEELGQIEYIFSDKTGTLTQNVMTFNKCSIGGKCYGDQNEEQQDQNFQSGDRVDFSWNPYYEQTFDFYDKALSKDIQSGNLDCQEFFRLLSLCHTVMPEIVDGRLEYQAQSPDENALVSAARNFGFVFTSRTPSSITISANSQEETYELLCILDFNNVRKRMSVILRKDGKIRLYCKGADSIILQRLKKGQEDLVNQTQEHLDRFAAEGLRTLLLAFKDLSQIEFEAWKTSHHEASIAIENREEKLDAVYEAIEKDLVILGATAIEDKLQDGVSQTIANLQSAGIKIWVLTGDKQETAINIGYSCQLLADDLERDPFIVDGDTLDEVRSQLMEHRHTILSIVNPTDSQAESKRTSPVLTHSISQREFSSDYLNSSSERQSESSRSRPTFALVVNGHSLVHALTPKMERLFLAVAENCVAVICCRVTPLQKALVVELVKTYKKAVTLSIGDGANDVSMIKTAHIGVGISGQEGMQAVLASDYSIAQFRFLERLLLVHGRWSYYRMCKFLRFFFYKNFAFTLCHFWYAFFCGFSAQTLYEPFFIAFYNVFYTSLPVLTMGIFDQDVDADHSLKFPRLYTPGLHSKFFNKLEFARSALQGIITSFFLFFITYGAYNDKVTSEGYVLGDHMLVGSVVATHLVVVVTAQVALDTAYWTVFNHITIWGSIIFYFIFQFGYNHIITGAYVGTLDMVMGEWVFWLSCLLTAVIVIVPVVAWRFYKSSVYPSLTDRVRLVQKDSYKRRPKEETRAFKVNRSRRSVRSGYAFSHSEGFGRLITSGKMMKTISQKDYPNDQELGVQISQPSITEKLKAPFRSKINSDMSLKIKSDMV